MDEVIVKFGKTITPAALLLAVRIDIDVTNWAKPITVPHQRQSCRAGAESQCEGPKGKLSLDVRPEIGVAYDDKSKSLTFTQRTDTLSTERMVKSLHGLSRTLVNNLIEGVTKGFEKKLKVEGIGYQAGSTRKNWF